ncbi:hypothetical protein BDQ12DRAFT_602139 [Crucibulum laeve]|uniref:Uncharacterized protein n=1 Tax=Crucibulum laeve TaxID=68775 RepID=A0A5C3M643_9AGAR|nr:hypothetical protein BDQ12DRAFT_602139 [Crucibulum laeve]
MSGRVTTPLRSAPPSLEAANQAQIGDLVQRNRTLENANRKLSEQVALEVARGKEVVSEIRDRWAIEKKEWRDGCDELLSCYRIVQQQTIIELQKERTNVLKEQEILRNEKLQRLQRDYRILKFQSTEAELEDRIAVLESERGELVAEHEATVKRLKGECAEYATQLRAKGNDVSATEQEFTYSLITSLLISILFYFLQKKLNKLREEHVHLQALFETNASKLERTTLQLEGAQTKCSELERANDELKRASADLKRQLDKWQSLETKGDEEASTQRKKRIELELQLKALNEQFEKKREEDAQVLAKEKRRVEKMKELVQQWQDESEKRIRHAAEADEELAQTQEEVKQLKAELDAERKPTAKPNSQQAAKPGPRSRQTTVLGSEVEAGPSQPKKTAKSRAKSVDNDIEEVEEPPSAKLKPKPKPKSKAKPKQASPPPEDNDSNIQDIAEVPKKGKGKAKTKAIDVDSDSDSAPPPPPTGKGKRKARDEDDDGEIKIDQQSTAMKTKKGKAGSQTRETSVKPRRKAGAGSRAGSVMPSQVDSEGEEENAAPKKKKRKINIFPSTADKSAFNFGTTSYFVQNLDIPSMLSPLKDSEVVPSRSTSSYGCLMLATG